MCYMRPRANLIVKTIGLLIDIDIKIDQYMCYDDLHEYEQPTNKNMYYTV